jgi:hypothetical protein
MRQDNDNDDPRSQFRKRIPTVPVSQISVLLDDTINIDLGEPMSAQYSSLVYVSYLMSLGTHAFVEQVDLEQPRRLQMLLSLLPRITLGGFLVDLFET